MAQKYYNVAEAAEKLGLTPAEINEMVLRRELYGYRDGADWKFKTEDIDRAAAERGAAAASDESSDNVLASEIELGASDPGLSGTVIGAERGPSGAESDIHLASDLKIAEKKPAASDANLLESDLNLAGSKAGGAKLGDTAAGTARFEELDMTLDQDLTLQESKPSGVPVPPAAKAPTPAKSASSSVLTDSAVDLSGKKLEDDDLVLGGSGAGSDISIGGDSGISLVDPADSGLNLEAPLNLAKDEESLELGEDDLLGMASDAASVSGLKSEDDFQLTPMEDLADTDDSESGSQVIALDTEGEGEEAGPLGGSPVAGLLDEDLGAEPTLAAMPVTSAATELGLAGPEDALAAGGAAAAVLPEAPYSIWNILSLVLVCLLLILVGMMMYELLRNMWGLNAPIKTVGGEFDSWLMDTILGWFGN